MNRPDREDTSRQQAALRDARTHLAETLTALAGEAKRAGRLAASGRGEPDMLALYALTIEVRRAEEAVDIAASDLHAASGGDT